MSTATAAFSSRHQLPVPDDHVVVLFGATGDLARRKLIPGLFGLARAGLMPEHFRIVATSKDALTDDEFRALARAAVDEFGRGARDPDDWAEFAESLSYADADDSAALVAAVSDARDHVGPDARLLHYLSVPPPAFGSIVRSLGEQGLNESARVIMEKPFGTDLESARQLNSVVQSVFAEEQVFRIDHFIGKEMVQNVLALRFANGMLEPVWNRDHIDYIQIDAPETLGLEGRAAFYEGTGAFKDMVVTHLFQVLALIAMEPPTSLNPKALLDEKAKVFEAMAPLDRNRVVRGRYEGYLDEPGVHPESETETFVALDARVDNWRWKGVPFFLRTGKRMARTRRTMTVAFKEPPLQMFPDAGTLHADLGPNKIIFELGDPGSITGTFLAKLPGPTMQLGPASFNFDYGAAFDGGAQLEAYERLIHDALVGDHTLFTRSDGIERLWEISMPLIEDPPPLRRYSQGSWGPDDVHHLVGSHRWHLPDEPA
jgi:glucose-6-phosphate 1-dehydrogenase